MRIGLRVSVRFDDILEKSSPEKADKLEYFRKKILDHLSKLEKEEEETVNKALELEERMVKGGFPVGTIHTYNGVRHIKMPDGKWRPKYDNHTRGAKMALSVLKKRIAAAKDEHEMLQLCLLNRDRFSGKDGNPLPFMQELHNYVEEQKTVKAKAALPKINEAKLKEIQADFESGKMGYDEAKKLVHEEGGLPKTVHPRWLKSDETKKREAAIIERRDNDRAFVKTLPKNQQYRAERWIAEKEYKFSRGVKSVSAFVNEQFKAGTLKLDPAPVEDGGGVNGYNIGKYGRLYAEYLLKKDGKGKTPDHEKSEPEPDIDTSKQYLSYSGKDPVRVQFSKNKDDEYYTYWQMPSNGDKSKKVAINEAVTADQIKHWVNQNKERLQKMDEQKPEPADHEESEDEKRHNRSEAMRGNQNAYKGGTDDSRFDKVKDDFNNERIDYKDAVKEIMAIDPKMSEKDAEKIVNKEKMKRLREEYKEYHDVGTVTDKARQLMAEIESKTGYKAVTGSYDGKRGMFHFFDGDSKEMLIAPWGSGNNGFDITLVKDNEWTDSTCIKYKGVPFMSDAAISRIAEAVNNFGKSPQKEGTYSNYNDIGDDFSNGKLSIVEADEEMKKLRKYQADNMPNGPLGGPITRPPPPVINGIDFGSWNFAADQVRALQEGRATKEEVESLLKHKVYDGIRDKVIKEGLSGSQNTESENPAAELFQTIQEKYKSAKAVEGDDDEVQVGKESLPGKWKLVEADTPTASHDETTFQKTPGFPANADGTSINDRDYEHFQANKEAVLNIASDYDGRALKFDSPIVVTTDGIVISGNNRTMSSKIAAKKGTDTKYIEALKKRAKKFGFSEDQVGQFKNPRIVFEVEQKGGYSTQQFAKFNESGKKEQGPTEKAAKISKMIKPEMIEAVAKKIDEFDTLGDLYRDLNASRQIYTLFKDAGLIGENEAGRYFENSVLTDDGKTFIETALLGTVINENNLRGFNRPGCKSIRATLMRALIPLVENKGMTGFSINKELNEAVDIAMQVAINKDQFNSVDEFARQQSMFEKFDPVAVELAKKMEGTQKAFAEFMRGMNGGLRVAANGEADIFLGKVESKEEILGRFLPIKKAITELLNEIKGFFG
jgi:hypothetical protein